MLMKSFNYLRRVYGRIARSAPYGTCFISQSYSDERQLNLLLDFLPSFSGQRSWIREASVLSWKDHS